MNRNRKSVSKTPVQKTNLLHFFQRTPVSVSSTQLGATESTTPSSNLPNSSATPFITRARPPTECPGCNKIVQYYKLNDHLDNECITSLKNSSGSSLEVSLAPKTKITDLVVPEFVLTTPSSTTTKREEKPLSLSAIKQDLSPSSTSLITKEETKDNPLPINDVLLTTPSTPSIQQEERKYNSTTKKNVARRQQISAQFKDHLTKTDNQKTSHTTINKYSDWSSVKKKLFVDEAKPTKFEGLPYYLETFLFLLKTTFDEPLHQHLFNEEDHRIYNEFKCLSLEAQKLYARLFSRKFQWRRKEKIVYEDIAADLGNASAELRSTSFLLGIDQLDDLPTLLKLLTQFELKQLFKETKIPFNGKGNAAEALMKHCRSQPCLSGSVQSMKDRMTAKIKRQYVKECYKLNEETRRVFLRLILLSTLHQRQEEEEEKGQQQQSFKMLQVKIGEKSYPSYRIFRQTAIFKQRDHFLKYGEASLLELQIRDSYDNKQWETLVEMTESTQKTFEEYSKEYQREDLDLPLFLRRYTAGSVYVYIFDKRIEALQCLKRYREAVDLIKMLINQNVYLPTHRGYWYERLALNLEQHLKEPYEAFEMIKNALKDSWVSPAHRFALSQRAMRLCQSPRWKQKLGPLLDELPLLTAAEPRCVIITGRSLPRDLPGHKSMFIRGDSDANMDVGDITLCSVEELVLQHYMENGYTHGVHGEGSTIWTVIGLLFWDVIYRSEIADVFLSQFQAIPLDFDTLDFYQSRQSVIEHRLECIRNWSSSEIMEEIAKIWNENHGQTSLVFWDRFCDLDHVSGLVQCISPHSLAAISQRLLQNYRHYRSGFPDLTVWNPKEKKWRIIEVKGPNDRLSPKQTLWLDFLVSLGIEAEVCHVQAVGAKRMGATPQVAVKSKSPRTLEDEEGHANEKVVRKSRRVKAKIDNV
ncbi:hypothetical protein GHT06_016235 [Daphnia sinensis]|uniref:Fanconi-associated nuclease n=1 Tax=Daphnia sinensis TaxID=1820382 RepID=A0AAD5KPU7_9CRUS|nr:hypothetical protein GHT06_016235 [Daphnia sinensis]